MRSLSILKGATVSINKCSSIDNIRCDNNGSNALNDQPLKQKQK